MEIYLIRHAQTVANIERRYLGRTDAPLSEAGMASFCNLAYPAVGRVYTSPLSRCRKTAHILYPMEEARVAEGLRECDFGAFENKTHYELKDQPEYQAWIASDGKNPPPGGESTVDFQNRCAAAFCEAVAESFADGVSAVAFVVHGGSIMALMDRFAPPETPPKTFYDWQPPNLGGWSARITGLQWAERQVLTEIKLIQPGG